MIESAVMARYFSMRAMARSICLSDFILTKSYHRGVIFQLKPKGKTAVIAIQKTLSLRSEERCHCEPAKGGRGNLLLLMKYEIASSSSKDGLLAMMLFWVVARFIGQFDVP